jgi:hypothetical protein
MNNRGRTSIGPPIHKVATTRRCIRFHALAALPARQDSLSSASVRTYWTKEKKNLLLSAGKPKLTLSITTPSYPGFHLILLSRNLTAVNWPTIKRDLLEITCETINPLGICYIPSQGVSTGQSFFKYTKVWDRKYPVTTMTVTGLECSRQGPNTIQIIPY